MTSSPKQENKKQVNAAARQNVKLSGPHRATNHGRKLLRFLEKKKGALSSLLIVMHDYPDPDAIAAAMALQYLVERLHGIRSRIVYKGSIGRVENRAMVNLLKIPIHKLRPSDIRSYEHAVLIDTQPEFKNNPYPHNKKVTMVIDQHPCVKRPLAELAIIDTDCGATSVILTQTLLQSGVEISKRVATALVYGILSDTLNLYRAHRTDIIQAYLDILPFCDMKILIRIQNPPKSRKFFSTLNRGLQNARAFRGLIVSHLGEVDHPDLVSEIADFLLTYKGMERSLCTGLYRDKLHVSLRSNRLTDETPEILRDIFDDRKEAGGHDMVAGGSFHVGGKGKNETHWAEAESMLVVRLLKRLRLPQKADFRRPF